MFAEHSSEIGTPALDDELLRRIAEGLQLTGVQYERAVRAYSEVAEYFADHESPFAAYEPDIHPQGSMAAGTTVRPPRGNEFDLDLVMQLALLHYSVRPMELLDSTFQYLRKHPKFGPISERKARCIRLAYAGDFHLDVVPACVDRLRPPTGIQVPDRTVLGWKASNPKGLLEWFKRVMVPRPRLDGVTMKQGTVAPAPAQVSAAGNTPLQLTIQFLKRHRDIYFEDKPDLATPSIIVTVLAGEYYDGNDSVAETLFRITSAVALFARTNSSAPILRNPADAAEIVSEKWHAVPDSWSHFRSWAQDALGILANVGRVGQLRVLESFVGKSALSDGLKRQAAAFASATATGNLAVSAQGLLVPVSQAKSSATIVRPHHFYGK